VIWPKEPPSPDTDGRLLAKRALNYPSGRAPFDVSLSVSPSASARKSFAEPAAVKIAIFYAAIWSKKTLHIAT